MQPFGIDEIITCASSQTLYDGKWHQLKLLVRPSQVTSFLDDQPIQEVMLEPVVPIYINGETQLSKRRGTDITVPVSNNTATEKPKQKKDSSFIQHVSHTRWISNCFTKRKSKNSTTTMKYSSICPKISWADPHPDMLYEEQTVIITHIHLLQVQGMIIENMSYYHCWHIVLVHSQVYWYSIRATKSQVEVCKRP